MWTKYNWIRKTFFEEERKREREKREGEQRDGFHCTLGKRRRIVKNGGIRASTILGSPLVGYSNFNVAKLKKEL